MFRRTNLGSERPQVGNRKGLIGMPEATPLPGDDRPIGYYIIADDAFAMRTWLMKPFSRLFIKRTK
ncbi:hypothetical protein DPMN_116718 [Dreissena polymorpha]|uniref:DDE Tnp4 domain-containing protein n=1 Tax=Dreissena polymorpha TaxID=45954 RepID=A0A9D4KPY5_DREPO|nr:hypothetical protein DPMN_116718 [Dreissena polymorpha]